MIDIDSLFFWFNKSPSYLSEYLESININIVNEKPPIIRANLNLSFSKIGDLLISKYGYEMKNKLIVTAIIINIVEITFLMLLVGITVFKTPQSQRL